MAFDNMFTSPVVDEAAKQRIKAAKDLQVQAAAAAAPVGSGVQAAQQMGAAGAAFVGQKAADIQKQQGAAASTQANLALQAATQKKQNELATQQLGQEKSQTEAALGQKMALTGEQRDVEQRLTTAEIQANARTSRYGIETDNNLSFLNNSQRKQLADLGGDVKQQLFDSRLQFAKDEGGRKFTNERQLADFAITSAKNKMEAAAKLQKIEQAGKMAAQLAAAAHNKVVEELARVSQLKQTAAIRKQKEDLLRMEQKAKERARARASRSKASTQIIIGASTIIGAVVGGVVGGGWNFGAGAGAGAGVGAGIGRGAGEAIAGASQKQ